MSDEPPHLRLVHESEVVELDMRGLRMWAVETAAMVVARGPKQDERVLRIARRFVDYVLMGDREA